MDKDNPFDIQIQPGSSLASPPQQEEAPTKPAQRTAPRQPEKAPQAQQSFPLGVLPPKLEELAKGAETALGMPTDFTGPAFLLAAATAAGNACQLKIKRAAVQKAVFFLALVGNPNTNKSSALAFALKPIQAKDNERFTEYKSALGEYEAAKGMSKKEREEAGIMEAPVPPKLPQGLASDATPEALARILQDNPKGIAVHRDELAGWFKDFNRYHQGSEQELWLSLWSLQPLVINRISTGPQRIPSPFVCVAGTIQPSVIEELAKNERGTNGFVDRLLFTWPDGLSKPLWTDDELNLPLLEAYDAAINRLLALGFEEEGKPVTFTLHPHAKKRLFHFFNKENKPLCDEAGSELLQGLHGKFDIHTARLIIPLHLLWWAYEGQGEAPPLEVGLETIAQAVKVAEFFRSQSLKVYERLHESSPVDKLTADRRKVYEALPDEFLKKEGLELAFKHGMPERTFTAWLAKDEGQLFEKVGHGKYLRLL